MNIEGAWETVKKITFTLIVPWLELVLSEKVFTNEFNIYKTELGAVLRKHYPIIEKFITSEKFNGFLSGSKLIVPLGGGKYKFNVHAAKPSGYSLIVESLMSGDLAKLVLLTKGSWPDLQQKKIVSKRSTKSKKAKIPDPSEIVEVKKAKVIKVPEIIEIKKVKVQKTKGDSTKREIKIIGKSAAGAAFEKIAESCLPQTVMQKLPSTSILAPSEQLSQTGKTITTSEMNLEDVEALLETDEE